MDLAPLLSTIASVYFSTHEDKSMLPGKSNKQRKAEQKAEYHNHFKPHQKPRSRRWQKGLSHKEGRFKR